MDGLSEFTTQKPIALMLIGEEGYALFWAIVKDEEGRRWLNLNAKVSSDEDGFLSIKIKRLSQTYFEIGINSMITSEMFPVLPAKVIENDLSRLYNNHETYNTFICLDDEEHIMNQPEEKKTISAKTPREIVAVLNEHVVGQGYAKKVLAVAVYEHYKRHQELNPDTFKSNILLIGPTGTGKTEFARTLAKMLSVPFVIADATTITQAGYVGEDAISVVQALFAKADFDRKRTETGIIYIDEIDKIKATKGIASTSGADCSGAGAQQALLKIIEGGNFKTDKPGCGLSGKAGEEVSIDTSKILFILGGKFEGLDEIIQERLGSKGSKLGFGSSAEKASKKRIGEILSQVQPIDLVEFGMISEIVGRMPVVATLHDLSAEDLMRVMKEPHNSLLEQFQNKFGDVKMTITEEALKAIAEEACRRGTGARGLTSILERITLDARLDLPDMPPSITECVIDENVVLGKKGVSFECAKSESQISKKKFG